MNTVLALEGIGKEFNTNGKPLKVLNKINLSVAAGESIAIVGPSGSGKSTMLGICAGLERPTEGHITLNGKVLADFDEDALAGLRLQYIGFVFQNFELIPTLTALENVMVPLELVEQKDPETRARELLTSVGLSERLKHYPSQLSGGEKQRVAIARAFANSPVLLLADEPTGNLDRENKELVSELLFALNKENGTTLIIATHDDDLATRCNRKVSLRFGEIV